MAYSNKDRYLIIGGTTKAATTSLFNYLAAHPEICAASTKETRFFISEDYFLRIPRFHFSQGAEKYDVFFTDQSDSESVRVEATPDYLYSPGTAQKLQESLDDVKAVFILREPVSRLISWYRYAKQRAYIPEQMQFEEYVEQQLDPQKLEAIAKRSDSNVKEFVPEIYFFDMLVQGCYSNYLQSYFDALGRDNVCIKFYEEICRSPRSVLKEICDFAGIDSAFYDEYEFEIFNKTKTMNNPQLHGAYEKFSTYIRQYTFNLPIHSYLKKTKNWFDRTYYNKLNTASDEKVEISPALQSKLDEYYQQEKATLSDLLERPLPW